MSDVVKKLCRLGRNKKNSGDFAGAIKCFRNAVEIAKAEHLGFSAVYKCKADLGAALLGAGRAAEALQLFEKISQKTPADWELVGDLYHNMGLAHQTIGNHAEAFAAFRVRR